MKKEANKEANKEAKEELRIGKSTHKILYRLEEENFSSPCIILDEASHKIGIDIGGNVIFLNIEEWHEIVSNKIKESQTEQEKKPGSVPAPDWDPMERNPRITDQIKELNEIDTLKAKAKDKAKNKSWWKFWKKPAEPNSPSPKKNED